MADVAVSLPSCPVHITERCSAKTIRRSWSFPSLSRSDKLHHHNGARSLLSFTGHVLRGRLLPLWVIGSSKPRVTFDPTFKVTTVRGVSSRSCGSHLQGECLKSQICALSSVCLCYVTLSVPNATREWGSFINLPTLVFLFSLFSVQWLMSPSGKSLRRRHKSVNVVQVSVVAQCVSESERSDCSQ